MPETEREDDEFVAFEEIWTVPVALPVLAGEKLTAMLQACPTFNDAGTVGKLVPQLLISLKPAETVMLVMVTA